MSINKTLVDLLDEDKPVANQKFVCVSFVSPENILKQKQDFLFEEFTKEWDTKERLQKFTEFMNFLSYKYNLKFDDMMTEILENIFGHKPKLFPPHILSKEHIRERYHCFRTLQRTSDTRAIEMNLKTTDIDIVNKWRHAGKKSSQPMKQYYAQIKLLMGPFKRYTKAL